MALITMDEIEGISPVFKGKFGHCLANGMLKLTGIDQLAERYARHEDLEGPDFVKAYLDDLGMTYQVDGLDHLKPVLNTPFITISNHPYGAVDGLIMIDLFGHLREDYKVMANKFLSMAKTIKDEFITVQPTTNDSEGVAKESLAGVLQAMRHVRAGHPLGLFPAGAVSDFSFKDRCVRDRAWQEPAIRLIQKMHVPVVPVCFFGQNSNFFYFLGLISWKIRTLRLPREILNKKNKHVKLGIGPVITVEEQDQCGTIEDLGILLRSSVYDLKRVNK